MGPPAKASEDGSKAKIKVRVKLNLHGIVGVESVQQIEEEEYEEAAPKKPDGTKVGLVSHFRAIVEPSECLHLASLMSCTSSIEKLPPGGLLRGISFFF